jgi:preprotein translocase subunit SecD
MGERVQVLVKLFFIALVCGIAIFFTVINLTPSTRFQNLKFVLGLDLQGGSDILLEVNFDEYLKNKISSSKDIIARELRKEKIGYLYINSDANSIQFKLRNKEDESKIPTLTKKLDKMFSLNRLENDIFSVGLTKDAINEMRRLVKQQSIEVIRRRIDEKGNKEISIQAGSGDKIILQVPGIQNVSEISSLLNVTAQLSFHLMDENTPFLSTKPQLVPLESKVLEDYFGKNIYYVIKNQVQIEGSSLINSNAIINNAEAGVSFELDGVGARRFAEITKANVGKPFAIVLDGKVLSAPTIRDTIAGGSGIISGSFTLEEAKELSLLLRSGALPASIKIVQERIVGPSLGADSMKAGEMALALALLLVALFMIARYRTFGIFSIIALIINLMLILAGLSILNSTLTLPGIAGIILTVGMSVDANVLIFERIREHTKLISSTTDRKKYIKTIEEGFKSSLSTILDSNLTTIVTGVALYAVGFGPIRGFAITLILGILTSMFSSIILTGNMIKLFARFKKFKTS